VFHPRSLEIIQGNIKTTIPIFLVFQLSFDLPETIFSV
jgi:hypothetical protein